MIDPTSVALPVDPYDTLSQRWGLSKLDPFEERWKVDDPNATLPYLKRQVAAASRQNDIAEQAWCNADDGQSDILSTNSFF